PRGRARNLRGARERAFPERVSPAPGIAATSRAPRRPSATHGGASPEPPRTMSRGRSIGVGILLAGSLLAACDSGPSGPLDEPPATFNMSVDLVYLVQSIQTVYGTVPMIAGRDAYLRVFGRANEVNSARPSLRVKLYDGTTLVSTIDAPFPGASLPTSISQAVTTDNWTIPIPGSLVTPGLALEVELDPDGTIAELTRS